MRYRGVLVRPLADQGDLDGPLIDPAGVQFAEGQRLPLTVEYDLANTVGYAVVSRAADGSLLAECEITETDPAAIMADPPRLAVGIVAFRSEDILDGIRRRVIAASRLNAVALTAKHSDPGQPAIERVEDD